MGRPRSSRRATRQASRRSRGIASLFLARRGIPDENQWTASARARDRAEAARYGILQEPLSVGLPRRRRPQPGDGSESVFVGIGGEALPRSGDDMTQPTISTIVVRVEELIRRAEATDQGSASESSQALAAGLRRTVLRPLADLGDTVDRTTVMESETRDVQWLLFELAMDLTRACATDQRAALLEACAGAHYLVSIGPDDARQRITRLAEMARDIPGDP